MYLLRQFNDSPLAVGRGRLFSQLVTFWQEFAAESSSGNRQLGFLISSTVIQLPFYAVT
jgi:hypothetical protein